MVDPLPHLHHDRTLRLLPGFLRIRQAVLQEYQAWMLNRPRAIPSPASSVRHSYVSRAGVRRIVLSAHEDRETRLAQYGHVAVPR